MNQKLQIAACVLIQDPDTGLILAVSRKDNPDDFGLPGGKLDGNESYLSCALRELKEETGIELPLPPSAPCFQRLTEAGKDGRQFHTVTFRTTLKACDAALMTTESGVIQWVPTTKLVEGSFGAYNRALFTELGMPF